MNIYLYFFVVATSVGLLVEGRPADSAPKILGGQDAVDGQFPYHLEMEYFGSLGWKHICGAVLLTPFYALTGAKCVNTVNVINIRVWAGLLERENYTLTNAQQISVNNIKIHESYSEFVSGLPYDIAVLRFAWAADVSRPNIGVALLPPDDSNTFIQGGCTIIGWGRFSLDQSFAPVLQYATVTAIANGDCADRMLGQDGKDILDVHICTLSDPPGVGACSGDSGSPLLCGASEDQPDPQYVVGISSWTVVVNGYCNVNYPTVYTRVSKLLGWISTNVPGL